MAQMPGLKINELEQLRHNYVSGSLKIWKSLSDTRSSQGKSIVQQVVSRIRGIIKVGNLITGDRLATEQQMPVAFAISRPTPRGALKTITVMEVLESRQGGTYTSVDLSSKHVIFPSNIMLSNLSRCLYDIGLDLRLVGGAISEVIRTSGEQHCLVADPIIFKDIEAAAGAYEKHLKHICGNLISVRTNSTS